MGLLVQSLKAAKAGEVVDLSNKVGELVENIIYRMILGSKNDDLFDVKRIVEEIVSLMGSFDIGDYVPFLKPFDLQVKIFLVSLYQLNCYLEYLLMS